MCIRIEVRSAEAYYQEGIAKQGPKVGQPYRIKKQSAWAYTFAQDGQPNPYPVPLVIGLEESQPPYAPGMYQLDPRCLYTDRFSELTIGRVKLLPLKSDKAA